MQSITRRLASLIYLANPLALTFIGIVLLSLGVAYIFIHLYRTVEMPGIVYYLTLQFLPRIMRGVLLFVVGFGVLAIGIWQLSGVVVFTINNRSTHDDELVLGYRRTNERPKIVVLSGGAGMLILSALGKDVERLTCITPVQEPVEYYYRASGLFDFSNVYFVVPTPAPVEVIARLDNGSTVNVMHINHNLDLVERHVVGLQLHLLDEEMGAPGIGGTAVAAPSATLALTQVARDALREADAIVLGPGSLFESILPNLLLDELRELVQQSKARKIYICNLMTEPGLTTGFDVAAHIREIKRYGGFAPDYVLVNAQRIDPAITQIYAAAYQAPVYLSPEEYEETVVVDGSPLARRQLIVEDSVIIETDLASSIVQYTASLKQPGESRAVRVLRHDQEKLNAALLELIRRS